MGTGTLSDLKLLHSNIAYDGEVTRTVTDEQNNRAIKRASLIQLAIFFLLVGTVWRIVDVFVFNLGETWLNILPSKLFPLLLMVGVFYTYRRGELQTVLGLAATRSKTHIPVGVAIGLLMVVPVVIISPLLYAVLIDPSYPTTIYLSVGGWLLVYSLFFFLINAIFEETLFRGLLQNSLRIRLGVTRAIVISALIFGVWHACWPILNGQPIEQLVTMILLSGVTGAFLGVYYEKFSMREALTGNITAHTITNFVNESLAVGADPQLPGPDNPLVDPGITAITLCMFVIVFAMLFYVVTHYRINQVERLLYHRGAECVTAP